MAELLEVIQNLGMADSTAEEIITALDVDVNTRYNSTVMTYSGLGEALEADSVDIGVLIYLKPLIISLPIGGETLSAFLASGGVNFTKDGIRQQIGVNLMHPSTTDPQKVLLNALLDMAIRTQKKWEQYGFESLPVADDINVVLTKIANIRKAQEFLSNILNPLVVSGDIQGIKDAVEGWSN